MQQALPNLTHRELRKIDRDHEASASVAQLEYVSDRQEGITRTEKGNGFSYSYRGRTIRDENTLARIKALVIPPAWSDVWICPSPDGHIQVTGYDVRGRKQYRYHPRWNALRQETKFHRMIAFGKALPDLREEIRKDLARQGFPACKVLAMVVALMEKTFIRVGNEGYEKLYGSYGLTTLKNDHVNIRGDQVTFSFKGKKGVYQKVLLKSRKFARILRQCKAIPGKELFQYMDESGEPRKIDSGQVNQYLKDRLQMDFTTKDFRTWAGTLNMLTELKNFPPCENKSDYQKNITVALAAVSRKLGNTVAVCRKYYVHPEIVRMYKDEEFPKFFCGLDPPANRENGLSVEEELLMKVLKVIQKGKVALAVA